MIIKMSVRHVHLLGLMILCQLFKGLSGADVTHKFISSGVNVSLPCTNALTGCTSTTWNYNSNSTTTAVELIAKGKKKDDIERRERLSLGSDCSLNIYNVTQEDFGIYTCKQYVNDDPYGNDSTVYLHLLHVSSSPSSQTEIRSGRSVTLDCQLFLYDRISCAELNRSGEIQLMWVNQAGVNLQTDSRYQISTQDCAISLTTTLLNEDHNREWRCHITQGNTVKASVTYTVRDSAQSNVTTPVTQGPTTDTAESHTQEAVISAVAAAAALMLIAVFCVIYKKRVGNKRATDSSGATNVTPKKETVNMTNHSMANTNEETDDVTYSVVTSSSKTPVKTYSDQSNDNVTYASIR